MCTVSWLTAGDRFHLLFNRDERHTRAPGLPPALLHAGGVAYLAPVDPDSGGTWFAASELGLLLCLLNRSVDGRPTAAGRRSRGSLIPELIAAPSLAEVARGLESLELADCSPFRLLANLPGGAALGAVWDGESLAMQPITTASGLLCSSSRGDRAATRVRSELWASRAPERASSGVAELRRFHRSHLPERSAVSVCMHRDDAATVSLLEATRTGDGFELAYFSGPPCTAGDPERSQLPLVHRPASC